ncbi:MAG: ECF-type sigma factor [Phycisphaerales bacterium]
MDEQGRGAPENAGSSGGEGVGARGELSAQVTLLARSAQDGDRAAAAKLLELVYSELRVLASDRLRRERPGQTLQATALVHEAYLRLVGSSGERAEAAWDGRGHFFAAAAEAMRRILIDRARARRAAKRGGDARRLALDPEMLTLEEPPAELADLDEALSRLELEDREKAMLVKLRFFGGLTLREAAEVMGISQSTGDRYWAYARAWLYHALSETKDAGPSEGPG